MTEPLASTWDEEMAPCVHEAGHAVIANLLGGRVAFVMVAPDGSGGSNISLPDPRREVVGRLAGRAAEQRYWEQMGGGPAECHPSHGDAHDREAAWAAALRACPGDFAAASELLERSRATAAGMVQVEWTRIESVASAVYQSPNRRLLGSVFLAMIEAEPPATTTAQPR